MKIRYIYILFLIFILTFLFSFVSISTSEAHVLVIGDPQGDRPAYYIEAKATANFLKKNGYNVRELYKKSATSKEIMKGMYNADGIIYVGKGGKYCIQGSDAPIYSVKSKMQDGKTRVIFKPPFKKYGIPVLLEGACYSMGEQASTVAGSKEQLYQFSRMFTASNAQYTAFQQGGLYGKGIYSFVKNMIYLGPYSGCKPYFLIVGDNSHDRFKKYSSYYKDTRMLGSTVIPRSTTKYSYFIKPNTPYDPIAAEKWYQQVIKNKSPIANAGIDQYVYVGDVVKLNGSDSTNYDGTKLPPETTYRWSFLLKPSESNAKAYGISLHDPRAAFKVDQPGKYTCKLQVTNGKNTGKDYVNIYSIYKPPVAEAGNGQVALVGDKIVLDGSKSTPKGGLTYYWSLYKTIPRSDITYKDELLKTSIENPKAVFTTLNPGEFIFKLIVKNKYNENYISEPDYVSVTFGNKLAYLFGAETYTYSDPDDPQTLSNLNFVNNNLDQMQKILNNNIYTTTKKLNFTRRNFTDIINFIAQPGRLKSEDQIIFYFSGHGLEPIKFPNDEIHYGICPSNCKPNGANVIYDFELAEWMSKLKTCQLVLILDCCHSGGIKDYFDQNNNKTILIASCTREQSSTDFNSIGISIFTYYFINAIKNKNTDTNNDQQVSVEETFQKAQYDTYNYTFNHQIIIDKERIIMNPVRHGYRTIQITPKPATT